MLGTRVKKCFFTYSPSINQVFQSEAFAESSFFSMPSKSPVFVLESTKTSKLQLKKAPAASPLSPSSYVKEVDVPLKEAAGFFSVNPSFPSTAAPTKIMDALTTALRSLDCEFEVVNRWTLRVSLLCVAELVTFSVELTRAPGGSYQVDFLLRGGCETKFCQLSEHVRNLCSDVDAEALPLILVEPLGAWVDAKQETNGRQFAISESEARNLIEELNCDGLHPEALYEVAKVVKDRCRHKGNRKLFLQADRENFLAALKWMLASDDDVARFGVFILMQFAKDSEADNYDAPFFSNPFDKSAFALLAEEVASRHGDAPCGKFTTAMVERVQQSWIFC